MRMEVENKQEESTQKLQLCARLGEVGEVGWLLRLISSEMTLAALEGVVPGDTESKWSLVQMVSSSSGKLGVVT